MAASPSTQSPAKTATVSHPTLLSRSRGEGARPARQRKSRDGVRAPSGTVTSPGVPRSPPRPPSRRDGPPVQTRASSSVRPPCNQSKHRDDLIRPSGADAATGSAVDYTKLGEPEQAAELIAQARAPQAPHQATAIEAEHIEGRDSRAALFSAQRDHQRHERPLWLDRHQAWRIRSFELRLLVALPGRHRRAVDVDSDRATKQTDQEVAAGCAGAAKIPADIRCALGSNG